MEVELTPDLQAKLDRLTSETGRSGSEFVQDAMAGYFEELGLLRRTLEDRYDEVRRGEVKPIPGEEVESPDERPLLVVAVIHGRRNPRVMAATLRTRQ